MSLFTENSARFRKATLSLLVTVVSLSFTHPLAATTITFTGQSQNSGATGIPWIETSTMWGRLDSATGTGESISPATGLSSLEGKDISLLTFDFGDLVLTDSQSPGYLYNTQPSDGYEGYEVYKDDGIGDATPFRFLYDNVLWATGEVNFLRVDVLHKADLDATAFLSVSLLTGGGDGTFFDELMELTNGNLELFAHSFIPVSADGKFTSITTLEIPLATVPIPAAVWLFTAGLLGIGGMSRFGKQPVLKVVGPPLIGL